MSLARLDALAAALKALPRTLTATVGDVVRAHGHVLEDANTAQLADGLDADNRDITPEYAPLTVEIKKEKGQPSDRVTLRDEGNFYASIVARVRAQEVEMEGTDPKTQELQQKYGNNIIGLSDAAVDEFREDYVRPELQAKTREVLGL
jgi:hypothetical protein